MALGWASLNLKTLSMTDSSVAVVSDPQNAVQSLTVIPAAITSLPRFTVPATKGTWRSVESSSKSSMDVWGWTWFNTSFLWEARQKSKQLLDHIFARHILREDVNSYQATSVGKGAVATNKNVTSNGLPKNFYSKNICNHLLSFLEENNTKYMSNLDGFLTYKN